MILGTYRGGFPIGLSERINSWILKKGLIIGLPKLD